MTPASPAEPLTKTGIGGRRRRLTLRVVLLWTVPPMLLGLYFVWAGANDYREVRQYEDWWSDQTSIRKFAWHRARTLSNLPRTLMARDALAAEQPGVEAIRLYVEPDDWNRMTGDVADRWDKWTDAELALAGERLAAEVKVRGDNSAHWITEKKSLSIKTARGDHYKGYRRIGLSLKEVLPQYLAHVIAPDFDVMVPNAEVVPLFVNDDFQGIYRFIERPDETYLRRHGHLPGNVYRADTAARGEYYTGLPRQVFLNPYIWDRTAENTRPTATADRGLFEFVEALNGTGVEKHLRFAALYDREELSRFLGLMLLFGDPYHMSGVHNQLWYEDPASGLLHPIVWDLRLLESDEPPRRSRLNRFWEKALRDPRLFDGALRAAADWIARPELRDRALAHVREVYETHREYFAFDERRAGQVHPVGNPDEMERVLDGNIERLNEWLEDTDVTFGAASGTTVGEWATRPGGMPVVLDFLVAGRIGCDLVALETGLTRLGPVDLYRDSDRSGELGQGDQLLDVSVEGGRLTLESPLALLPGCRADGAWFEPEPIPYRLFVVLPPDTKPADVRPVLVARANVAEVEPRVWTGNLTVPEPEGFHPWSLEPPRLLSPVLKGTVQVTEDLLVERGSTLRLDAGTRLVLGPDVSIEIRGQVIARGTAEQPIVIEAADPTQPWGTFALQGAGANGSVFEHVHFSGGGGALLGRVEYKGMVCVHHAEDVTFESCRFADNVGCDDQLNAVLAGVDVRNCEFEGALADAIDFDLTTGEIEGCVIRDPGNDGIDLMSCSPRILSNRIEGAGDKGISIGEGSHPLVFDTLILDCERGLHIKDMSEPLILDSRIEGCDTGVVQDRKNWRFSGPGRGRFVGTVVARNGTDYEASGGATVTMLNTSLGEENEAEGPPWMRAAHGFGPPSSGPDLPRDWERVPASEALYSIAFAPDLHAPADGWSGQGGFARVDAYGGDLVAELRDTAGTVSRTIDWDLSDDGYDYRLVAEAAGSGLADPRLLMSSNQGLIVLSFEMRIDEDEDTFRYTTRELVPGRYTSLGVAAAPEGAHGRLRLHRVTVLRRPKEAR